MRDFDEWMDTALDEEWAAEVAGWYEAHDAWSWAEFAEE